MPATITVLDADDGATLVVDADNRIEVRLGSRWGTTRLRPLGGEPGPTTTPLRALDEPDVYLAVSAGRTAIRAASCESGGVAFEVTVVVRTRPGTKTFGGQR